MKTLLAVLLGLVILCQLCIWSDVRATLVEVRRENGLVFSYEVLHHRMQQQLSQDELENLMLRRKVERLSADVEDLAAKNYELEMDKKDKERLWRF